MQNDEKKKSSQNTLRRIQDRLDKRIQKEKCVEWLDKKQKRVQRVRARFIHGNRREYVARVLYEEIIGEIPKGHELIFSCGKFCVNPHHAKIVEKQIKKD